MDHGNRKKQDNRCTNDGKGNLSWKDAPAQNRNQDDPTPEVTPQHWLTGELWFRIPREVLAEFGYTIVSD